MLYSIVRIKHPTIFMLELFCYNFMIFIVIRDYKKTDFYYFSLGKSDEKLFSTDYENDEKKRK